MSVASDADWDVPPHRLLRRRRKHALQRLADLVALSTIAAAGLLASVGGAIGPVAPVHRPPGVLEAAAPTPVHVAWFDPSLLGATSSAMLDRASSIGSRFIPAAAEAPAPPPAQTVALTVSAEAAAPGPHARLTDDESTIPFPAPRPPDLDKPSMPRPYRGQSRQTARLDRAPSSAVPDTRSFFERLFGAPPAAAGPALAYAAPESALVGRGSGFSLRAVPAPDAQTAVYDISARTVTLPDGTRLEAHSGLGDKLDDPRYVHVRMRGATPPHVYDLTLREKLFHGVRALRLTPVGNGNVFGRTGLLAHTFMLGPNGDSNGCVSFRDYEAFLQAYLNGRVRRLAVVARS